MEIRDVIGSLRERDLQLQADINALRLDLHVLQFRLSKLDDVPRETKEVQENADPIETPDSPAPAPKARVGKKR